MTGFKRCKQGYYNPQYNEKYRGSLPIVYRSGLELNFFRWCDRNDKVLQWGSESVVVPYISPKDGRSHRYFIDGVLVLDTKEGPRKYIVEVKPYRQTIAPKVTPKKKKKNLLYEQITWAVNLSKWESAKAWGNKHGYEFVILTEKDLK